jgi:hypothetical protein
MDPRLQEERGQAPNLDLTRQPRLGQTPPESTGYYPAVAYTVLFLFSLRLIGQVGT